jgi:tRNA threonylcarbamoyladenosine biosynthesis protein TsaB
MLRSYQHDTSSIPFFPIFVATNRIIMIRILCLETSTEVCSVAIVEDGKVTGFREDILGQNHSKLLTLFISQLLESNQLTASDFDAVGVSEGPGSYTGLRIGVSVAKGFCYAAGIPLIAINSLEAMVWNVIENPKKFQLEIKPTDLFIPMIDARRMEVFTAIYNSTLKPVRKVNALVVEPTSFQEFAENSRLFLFGNGSAKCRDTLTDPAIHYIDEVIASSTNMATIANKKFQNNEFVDVAYFEPFYLKDFIATVPKNSVLGR